MMHRATFTAVSIKGKILDSPRALAATVEAAHTRCGIRSPDQRRLDPLSLSFSLGEQINCRCVRDKVLSKRGCDVMSRIANSHFSRPICLSRFICSLPIYIPPLR